MSTLWFLVAPTLTVSCGHHFVIRFVCGQLLKLLPDGVAFVSFSEKETAVIVSFLL